MVLDFTLLFSRSYGRMVEVGLVWKDGIRITGLDRYGVGDGETLNFSTPLLFHSLSYSNLSL